MSDDLSNNWGTQLINLTRSEEREYGAHSKQNELDEFKRIISNHFSKEFVLHKICQDGSTANLLAIVDATFGNTSCCYIAAGSYLSATDTVLQNLSTSSFYLQSSFSIIRTPDEDDTMFIRQQMVALPYFIEGTMSIRDLEKYEDSCFRVLHEKCLIMRIKGSPMKCIILELMLAGNGAILSNRSLKQLAYLSIKHDFNFIVDEIMTGGRTGTMLLLLKKPIIFVERVTHVTLGKWLQAGMVLISKSHHEYDRLIQRPACVPRLPSTSISLSSIIPIWNKVVVQLPLTDIRRNETIKQLKCRIEDVWGEGVLIFAPVKNTASANLKCRYLPRLERQKLDSPYLQQVSHIVSKTIVNHLVVEAVNVWKNLDYLSDDDKEFVPLIKFLSFNGMINRNFEFQTEEINTDILHFLNSKKKVADMLRKLQTAGLISYKMSGRRRLRSWDVLQGCCYEL